MQLKHLRVSERCVGGALIGVPARTCFTVGRGAIGQKVYNCAKQFDNRTNCDESSRRARERISERCGAREREAERVLSGASACMLFFCYDSLKKNNKKHLTGRFV